MKLAESDKANLPHVQGIGEQHDRSEGSEILWYGIT